LLRTHPAELTRQTSGQPDFGNSDRAHPGELTSNGLDGIVTRWSLTCFWTDLTLLAFRVDCLPLA
jgi:hypothetical protein